MESKTGRRRWRGFVLLAAACLGAVGLTLLACRGRALQGANTSADVRAAAEESGAQRPDVSASATEPPPDDTRPAAVDSSSSPCSVVSGNYGACDAVLGWGFDGKVCRRWSGCDCGPDCARLYPTALACAQACRMRGGCNSDALVSQGIGRLVLGGSCYALLACVPAGLEGELGLDLPDSCPGGGPCADGQSCLLKVPADGTIDEALWDRYCTASLVSGVRLECSGSLL
jgi:hypothetical protein